MLSLALTFTPNCHSAVLFIASLPFLLSVTFPFPSHPLSSHSLCLSQSFPLDILISHSLLSQPYFTFHTESFRQNFPLSFRLTFYIYLHSISHCATSALQSFKFTSWFVWLFFSVSFTVGNFHSLLNPAWAVYLLLCHSSLYAL